MYSLSVGREVETAQSDFSGLSDVESVGSNLQALKNELDKTREELDKVDNIGGVHTRSTKREDSIAPPPENSPMHDCTSDMKVIKAASDRGIEENLDDDWSSYCSGLLEDDNTEHNTGKFWQCTKNTVSTMMKLVEEVKAVRSERESLRQELALSEVEVGLLQQKLQKGGTAANGSNVVELENIFKEQNSAEVDKQQRHSTTFEPIVHDNRHINSEVEQATGKGRRHVFHTNINNLISKLNENERHSTHLTGFGDHSDGKAIFHYPKGSKEASMPREFIGLSQQVQELQDTVKRQVKEIEELHVLRENEAKESMKLQDTLQGKLLKLQEIMQEQTSQWDAARDLRETVKELKAMTMTAAGEKKKDQNSLAMTSCRSYPPNLTSRCWCESSTSFGLERSGIVKGQHGSTNHKAELAHLKFRLESRLEQLESMYSRVKAMEKDIITDGRKNVIGQRAKDEDELRLEVLKERALREKALQEREKAEKQLQRVLIVARRALMKTLGGGGRDEELSERVVARLHRRKVK